MKTWYIRWLLILLGLSNWQVSAQPGASLYVLSIGSADYETNFTQYEAGFAGWPQLPAAATSARQMVKLLGSSRVAYLDSLISRPNSLVTRAAVLTAVRKLSTRALREHRPNPLLIFYFAGHGVSEGFGWNLFMMPGNFTATITGRNAVSMGELAVYAGDVYDALAETKLPFVMLLDCCYEGQDEKATLRALANQQTFQQVAALAQASMAIVRKMNEFAEPNPVVFSAVPGQLAEAVPLPGGKPGKRVGPVCRRAMLASAQAAEQPLTLDRLLLALTSPVLDTAPKSVAISNWDRAACSFKNYRLR
ncbi:caspase family protein [Hymenobacter sp. BT186]|uniref:Caspase family protein n=1 Tax=Hymenobacter telluris TaxID=2816474 RepID=A0A939F0W2_9BACT|nr:caspase family protein [Hymenobacter telluris]MBO0360707.1 caspase family protein [Hymenobacter telluris]MBW3376734.1 caspase family protein [Hymenobacter norwichensis]